MLRRDPAARRRLSVQIVGDHGPKMREDPVVDVRHP
jgi:hypothetical protein